MYSKIVNPATGRKISINSKKGKAVLKNYINIVSGGSLANLKDNITPALPDYDAIQQNIKNLEGGKSKPIDLKTAVSILKNYYHGKYN
tara:strand:- start:8409 stop:8672 length:264 start_codon:yes stop_codon:yes gene_type:complete